MNAISKPIAAAFHLPRVTLPRLTLPRLSFASRRRRRATIDLMHSSPHLLRDIGVVDGRLVTRDQ